MQQSLEEVYPHVCGGTKDNGAAVTEFDGLSPRVRGNPIVSDPMYGITGSIPTCAGEPITTLAI